VTFNLGTQVGSPAQLLVSKNGVIQKPGTDYTLASGGTQITFTTAPASGASIFIVEISGAVGGPINSDLNGNELVLDVDGDTSITADTDDQIDVKIGGTDQFSIKDGVIEPTTDNDVDLGSSSKEFKDAFFDGTVTSDAGTFDTLGVGSAKDLGTGIHIKTADSGASAHGDADELVIEGSGASGLSILSANDNNGNIIFSDDGGNERGAVRYLHASDAIRLDTAAAERVRVDSSGHLLVGKTSLSLDVAGVLLDPDGISTFTASGSDVLYLNRKTNDGTLLSFYQDGSGEGYIGVSGSTVSYNGFTGTHWSRLADNSKPTILRGTIMESLDEMCDWYQAVADVAEVKDSEGNITTPAYKVKEYINLGSKSVGDSITFTSNGVEYTGKIEKEDDVKHAKTKVSDTEASKAVYGLFVNWDEDDTTYNDMFVAQTGTYIIRIHKDETVSKGDLIQSKGDGTGKVQADDIMRSSTVAKVLSTTKIETYSDGSYIVPCSLHC
jgi:predicted DNA-binding protein